MNMLRLGGLWKMIGYASLLIVLAVSSAASMRDSNQYCQWESFNASCPADSVIRITSAKYGRMRIGKCMERDYYIGCSADVTAQADDICSGRRTCVITVPNPALHEIQPCPKDIGAYLEADYECVKVQTGNDDVCHAYKPLVVDSTSGYLSNLVTEESGYGTGFCPWKIRLRKGQRVNITLYDYSVAKHGARDSALCPVYASIQEGDKGPGKSVTVCGGQERTRKIFTSVSNEVEINIAKRGLETPESYFLLKYEALGCVDLTPPIGGYAKRAGESLEVGCNGTTEKWHLVCRGTQWVGQIKNCTGGSGGGAWRFDSILQDGDKFPFGLVVSIIIGIVLGVIIGTSLLAVVLFCRRRRLARQRRKALLECNTPQYTTRTESGYGGAGQKFNTIGPGHARPVKDTTYTHMWESRGHNGGVEAQSFTFPRNGINTVSTDTLDNMNTMSKQHVYPPRNANGNHIYESPKFTRKMSSGYEDRPYYHEFDPNQDAIDPVNMDLPGFMTNCNASDPR